MRIPIPKLMRFLQLIKKFPYPPKDGESLLVSSFNKELKERIDKIDLLSFNTIKHHFDISKLPGDQNHYEEIHDVYLDNRIKWHEALFNIFSKTPYHISRFITQGFEDKLISVLNKNQYDFVLMESIYLAPYIPVIRKFSKAKIILRAHNIEHEIWERIAKNTSNIIKKTYIDYLTNQLKTYELKHIGDADIIVTLTSRDLKKLRNNGIKTVAHVVPAGISIGNRINTAFALRKPIQISFLGSLDWLPNLEGLKWFINNVWDNTGLKNSNTTLHIAGRNTPESIFSLENNNIKVHGEVRDSKEFLLSYPIMVVPLLSGGGMRLKILEAMALGRVIISTSIGFEGINATDGKNILVANTAKEFQEKIEFCIDNPSKLKQISSNAKQLFDEKYETSKIVDSFLAIINSNK